MTEDEQSDDPQALYEGRDAEQQVDRKAIDR